MNYNEIFSPNQRSRGFFVAQRLILFIVAVIGVAGQTYFFHHDLVECYPYKMMSNPPELFYAGIAQISAAIAPPVALVIAWIFASRKIYALPASATSLCPAIFLLIFTVKQWSAGIDMAATNNFDGTTPTAVYFEFGKESLMFSFAGFLIGSGCGLAVKSIFTRFAKAEN